MDTPTLLERIRADWQRTEPALDPSPMLTFITLQRAAGVLGDAVEATALPVGLNHSSRDVLFTLHRSAGPDGLPASELANLLAVSPASVTGRVDRLEARGWVTRTLDPEDRRSWRIALTDAGRALVREHLPTHLAHERALLAVLNEAEVRQLETLLLRLIRGAEG
ncbi:MarR family winged helix-turn-helix transcriptional regulator [Deinococcus hopiensis]|uniref:DNA-binding transcriptional regulator, MarR family n=1 Tax=Deinococcus hopiensis KR-140 TaxID=695939 RepID=A0A1W1VAW8_9DEIO|nr:MarR family transcriptional regulator [Deinococcus hopiensis]SMB90426.1 DNA-binding transcriptional regulator, MarR family [Deinococcus hopiensis KR-140]